MRASLELYTRAAAACAHASQRFGTIEAGLAADLVVLDADPLDPQELKRAQVDATFVAGRCVHQRSATPSRAGLNPPSAP